MKEVLNACENCLYFHQHYGISKGKIYEIYFGHCTFKRIKHIRKPDKNICEHFVYCNKQENEFLSKQFIYKELLQYVLKLEIFPKDNMLCEKESMKKARF